MPACDVIVHGGMIVDGTPLPRYRADIGIKEGRVAKIGRLQPHYRSDVSEIISG